MSLLTALLAFVPGALIARPEPEPESLKAMTESRNKAARRVAELMDELIALRRERDDALARLDVHQRVQRLQILGAQGIACGQFNPCTCVPGRYDALRQEYPRVFDAGHSHGA